jgi:hypothetical protein
VELGATVCANFMMLLTADTSFQVEGDSERVQRSLQA